MSLEFYHSILKVLSVNGVEYYTVILVNLTVILGGIDGLNETFYLQENSLRIRSLSQECLVYRRIQTACDEL